MHVTCNRNQINPCKRTLDIWAWYKHNKNLILSYKYQGQTRAIIYINFVDLILSIFNYFASSKIYDKRDDFDFDIVSFPFLDVDVSLRPSYGVYGSQFIRFASVCSHVNKAKQTYLGFYQPDRP